MTIPKHKCPTCGADTDPSNPALVEKILLGWRLDAYDRLYAMIPGATVKIDAYEFTLVAKQDPNEFRYNEGHEWQGENPVCYVVFLINGVLYRKSGFVDSYGDNAAWTQALVKVAAIKKESVTWS